MLLEDDHSHSFWNAVVSITGVAYFLAWSYSFYPQLILNYKRKRTDGLSPDFIYLNPLGFLALTIWSWGAYFSPVARQQYQARHDGHLPQVSASDLAFSLHALVISTITLGQVWWYARRQEITSTSAGDEAGEDSPLINSQSSTPPYTETNSTANLIAPVTSTRPSIFAQLALVGIVIAAFISAALVWAGKAELLDWLYFISSIKLFISAVKYVPQVILNWRLKSVDGFAIGQIICDLIGSVLSFAQLVISSIFIDHDPSGIIANPAKLGLSALSMSFDLVFIVQKYWFFRDRSVERILDEQDNEQ